MKKRILSAVLVGALSASVIAGGVVTTSAKVAEDESYVPEGVDANKYYFAMPGGWETDYWKQNENRAGIYWWTGADVPKDNFAHEWPGYVVPRVKEDPVKIEGNTPVELKNLYETFVPKDSNMIIFNNHINGGMPSEPDFNKEKFDAAKQIVDTNATYNYIGYDDYQDKALWVYVYDQFCDQFELPRIVWDTTTKEHTKSEKAQIRALLYPASKLKDNEKQLIAEAGFEIPEKSVYEMVDDGELDPDEFFIDEFGTYALNFYLDTAEQAGVIQNFDNMVYVCNLEPNSMKISTTIVPEGMPTFGGDFFFYYGNGEFGTFPTKEMTIKELGITFAEDGTPVAGEGYSVDKYGFVVKAAPGLGFEGADTTMMVYGNFTGLYYESKEAPEVPTSAVEPTTAPAPSPDATSATSATSGSGTSGTNSANGSVATGDFSFAVIMFVVVIAGIGAIYFARRRYSK